MFSQGSFNLVGIMNRTPSQNRRPSQMDASLSPAKRPDVVPRSELIIYFVILVTSGVPIAVWRDGKTVRISPDRIMVRDVEVDYSISRKRRK
jgi:hypothetical protein